MPRNPRFWPSLKSLRSLWEASNLRDIYPRNAVMGLRGQLWQGGRIIPKLNQKATQCNRHAWPFVAHLLRIFFLVVLKGYLADMGATTSLGVVIPVDPIGPDQSINPSIVRHAHDVVIE